MKPQGFLQRLLGRFGSSFSLGHLRRWHAAQAAGTNSVAQECPGAGRTLCASIGAVATHSCGDDE